MYVSPCPGLNHLSKYAFCNNYNACVDVAYKVLLSFTLDASCVPCMFHESHD
jgi:hypothetical protein